MLELGGLSKLLLYLTKYFTSFVWVKVFFGSVSRGRIDRIVLDLLGDKKGFYVEVGAADGVQWSNTFWLERKFGWRGILIEPSAFQYKLCCFSRGGNNNCINIALGAALECDATLINLGLSSIISDELHQNTRTVSDHIINKIRHSPFNDVQRESVSVVPFSSLAKEFGICSVDFFSIDVEGFEVELLRGIDFKSVYIKLLCIETAQLEAISSELTSTHKLIGVVGKKDYFFLAKDVQIDESVRERLFCI